MAACKCIKLQALGTAQERIDAFKVVMGLTHSFDGKDRVLSPVLNQEWTRSDETGDITRLGITCKARHIVIRAMFYRHDRSAESAQGSADDDGAQPVVQGRCVQGHHAAARKAQQLAEEAWEGAAVFSARAWLNHSGSMLYLAVEVTAPAPAFRPRGAPNPEWDNENPDIHSDGIQVYVDAVSFFGWLIVPDADEPARLKVAAVAGTDAEPEMVQGAWQPTDNGYRITCAFELPDDLGAFGFDLHVNRIREGRERRTAQLVWSGARGSRLYLAGDRPLTHSLPLVAAREGR